MPAKVHNVIRHAPSSDGEKYYDTPEAAEYLRFSAATLNERRMAGDGPIYFKVGGRVVYARRDLDAWMAAYRRTSTSEPRWGVSGDVRLPPTSWLGCLGRRGSGGMIGLEELGSPLPKASAEPYRAVTAGNAGALRTTATDHR